MRQYFNSRNENERRLIWFAPPGPSNTPDQKDQSPETSGEETEEEKKFKEELTTLSESSNLGDAAKNIIKNVIEEADKQDAKIMEAGEAAIVKAAAAEFTDELSANNDDVDAALAKVNEDFAGTGMTFELNADGTGITAKVVEVQLNAQESAEVRLAQAVALFEKTLEGLTQEGLAPTEEHKRQALKVVNGEFAKDGLAFKLTEDGTSLELDEKGVENMKQNQNLLDGFREVIDFLTQMMNEITDALNGRDADTGLGGETGDTGEQGPEGQDETGGEGGSENQPASGAEGGAEGGGNESDPNAPKGSPESKDITLVQNPKEEMEEIDASLEDLNKEQARLEAELTEISKDGETTKEERDAISGPLDKVEAQIKAKTERKASLEKELNSRKQKIDEAWNNATGKRPEGSSADDFAVASMSLENGDDIVVRLADGMTANAELVADLTGMGMEQQADGTFVLKDVPPNFVANIGQIQGAIDKIALAPNTSKEDAGEDGGDLLGGNVDKKEASPEILQKLKELNEQLDNMVEANREFMNQTPIGAVLMDAYYVMGENGNITMTVSKASMAQLESIVTANGREVDAEGNVTGYKDGGSFNIGSGEYPSRYAWGGAEGDTEGQITRASDGMKKWASIMGENVPEDTKEIDADTQEVAMEDVSEDPDSTHPSKKIKEVVDDLKGSLDDAVDKSAVGKFINSLEVGAVGENVAITSKVDRQTFSHFYNLLEMGGTITQNAEGNYTVEFSGDDVQRLEDSIGRVKSFLGSTVEVQAAEPNDGGDLLGGDGGEPGTDGDSGPEGPLGEPGNDVENAGESADLVGLQDKLGKAIPSLKDRISIGTDGKSIDIDIKGLPDLARDALTKLGYGSLDGDTLNLTPEDANKLRNNVAVVASIAAAAKAATGAEELPEMSAEDLVTGITDKYPVLGNLIEADGSNIVIKGNGSIASNIAIGILTAEAGLTKEDDGSVRITPEEFSKVQAFLA